MAKQVTLTLDGRPITVPEGMLIVDAAKNAGTDIPVFCYHPKLEPVGMCRMCLVEIGRPMMDRNTGQPILDDKGEPKIQFGPKLETACTTPVSEGMRVLTQSEKAKAGQKSTVEFLLTSHPLDCPICDKGGECPLQNLTMAYGPGKSRFLFDEKQHLAKNYPLGELIFLDRERCIQCARCVRFQDEVAGDSVLGFDERGRSMQIISLSEPGFDSVFSGNTTDICPVGALTTVDFRFGARPWELSASASVCSQCPVGCNITFNTRREAQADGQVVIKRVMPRQNEDVNEIWLCDKGRFAYHYTESKERLSRPQTRKEGRLQRASWETATKLAGTAFAKAKKNLLVLASGRLSNEDLFNLKALADQVGGKAALYSNMGGGELTLLVGVGAGGANFGQLGKGSTIVIVASDLYEEAPIWYLRIKQAVERGATLIVANPRETKLDRFASFVIRYAYGDEVRTVQELMHKGKIGDAFVKADNALILYGSEGLGLTGSAALASACARALHDTGHFGKPNNGLIGVWPHANDQGAWEFGFRPAENLQAAFDKADAVYIAGADPFGDGAIELKSGKRRPFIVVQDLFETQSAALADVVLPAQAYTEREGTFTSGERRVQRFYRAVPALEGARADFIITSQVARQMGVILEGTSASVVFEILAADNPAFAGLTYDRLAEVRPQWPIVGERDLYYGGTTYANRQGLGVQLSNAAERSEKFGLPRVQKIPTLRPKENKLLAVPVTKLYDRGLTVSPGGLLKDRVGEAFVALHPSAADKLGVEAGQRVALSLDGTSKEVVVKIDSTISAGVALVPRSMGLPITEPTEASVRLPGAVGAQSTARKDETGREVTMDWTLWLEWFIKAAVMLLVLLTGFAYLTLYERRALARIQTRIGPNRAGPQGLLQPIADAVKLIFKEEFTPARADRLIFVIAPVVTVVPAMIIAAVIPLGTQFTLPFVNRTILLHVADINVGVLYLSAIASIAVYGIVLAGWSSNNKYALLGGMRSTAQMISYELALGLCFVVAILLGNSMSLVDIVEAQKGMWFAVVQPVGALIFMITTLAEVNRAPFDMPEAEQELAAGYHSEYSGMKFALFFMAEYEKMIVICMIAATLYFGGYREFWFLKDTVLSVDRTWWLGPIYLLGKVVVLLFFMIWIRATWPRIRYDRLMTFGWKVLLPLSIAVVVLTAFGILLADQYGAMYLWSIPLLSILAGFITVLLVNFSMRRKVAHA